MSDTYTPKELETIRERAKKYEERGKGIQPDDEYTSATSTKTFVALVKTTNDRGAATSRRGAKSQRK